MMWLWIVIAAVIVAFFIVVLVAANKIFDVAVNAKKTKEKVLKTNANKQEAADEKDEKALAQQWLCLLYTSLLKYVTGTYKKEFVIVIVCILLSVSYTHLDVYKRQVAVMTWGLIGIIAGAILVFIFLMLLIKRTNDKGMDALKKVAFNDPLTGYHNYSKFLTDARKLLRKKNGKQYSLWYSDLKNFKVVNDLFGYEAGDRVLKYWADLIASDMREGEAFCRVTGDNFVVLREYISLSLIHI